MATALYDLLLAIRQRRLRYLGHILRMPESRVERRALVALAKGGSVYPNGVARILVWGGATRYIFRHLPGRRPDSVGGGVVAEIFPLAPGRRKSNSISTENFFYISGPPGEITRHLWTLTRSNNVTTINSLEKKHLPKVWGGPWPPWPPLATPLVYPKGSLFMDCQTMKFHQLVALAQRRGAWNALATQLR